MDFARSKLWQDQLFVPLGSLISSARSKKWLQLAAELLLKKNRIMSFCHGNNSFGNQQWEFYVPLFLQLTCECVLGEVAEALAQKGSLWLAPGRDSFAHGKFAPSARSCCLQAQTMRLLMSRGSGGCGEAWGL